MIKVACSKCSKIGWHRNYKRNNNFEKIVHPVKNEDNTITPVSMRRYRNRIETFSCLKHRDLPLGKSHPKRIKKKGFSKGKKQK